MPSAVVGNSAVQSAIPDLGCGSNSEAMKQVLGVIDKKVRNMEKKKGKLDDYQAKKNKGERLNQDQLEALSKYQEITYNLEFARDLQKSFLSLGQEIQKAVKKSVRREQLQREETEQQRLKTVLELQFLLDQLGDDNVRQDLIRPGVTGSAPLTEAELTSLDDFYKVVGPERNYDVRLTDQYEEASLHLWELLEGRDKAVAGTTYKSLKETLDKVLSSGYFDRAQTHQNGTCKEEEEEEDEEEQQEPTPVAQSKAGEQPSDPEGTVTENFTEPINVETTEFVNRQFIPETSYSNTDNDQVEEWTVEAQMVNSLQHQPPAQLAAEPPVTVNHVAASPTADPVVRKQVVQDLMAQMQGTYNFMQDSMLEFDGQALDPAIVSAQPMKPVQRVDLQRMASTHAESRLHQASAVSGPQESSQASMPLSSEQSLIPCSLSSAFPPVSKPTHSGGINVNAAPFHSVQAVFNMNAPVPPASEGPADPLKQQSQFSDGYAPRFSGQSENSVEQPEIPQGTLQSGGYENYRPPFSNASRSGYGQAQFNTSRDYSNNTYRREGYQPGYKRGAAQGPRGYSRGNPQAVRS
ncbi:caprin-1a isoform X1 [Genypterus blacodes]|uniref:caprin-1a isoform X1 n=1 Tax=Genypterus blacodes TaxID=154954 RepID=UPI003F75D58C